MSDHPQIARIVIADDHPLVRDGLKAHLNATEHLRVVGEADNGRQALELALSLSPDLVLADVNMEDIGGIDLARRLREQAPTIKIMILSMHSDAEYVSAAIAAGARGYVLKGAPSLRIIAAIDSVLAGDTYYSVPIPELTSRAVPATDTLTERENEVLVLLAQGDTNKRIAQKLDISTRTVETHRLSLRRKLGIATPAGLVKYAMERGLIK